MFKSLKVMVQYCYVKCLKVNNIVMSSYGTILLCQMFKSLKVTVQYCYVKCLKV